MWGAVMEEDLYDKNQPFYVHKPEIEKKLKEKISELPDNQNHKIKKKTIYTLEIDPVDPQTNQRSKSTAFLRKIDTSLSRSENRQT